MSVSGLPAFVFLPLGALLAVLGTSVPLAGWLRRLADRENAAVSPSTGSLAVVSAIAQLLVWVAAGFGIAAVGGLAAGPLFAPGAPLLGLFAVLGLPICLGASLFVRWLDWASEDGATAALRRRAGLSFAAATLLTLPIAWGLVVLLG